MTIVVVLMGCVLALLGLFVVALLRSHAEILRRLLALEATLGQGPAPAEDSGLALRHAGAERPAGGSAPDITGETLSGDAVKLSVGAGSSPTLLAFMGSGCAACVPLWHGLAGELELAAGARLVVITKGRERERLARLLELAPADAEVVMSTAAWRDYQVPSSPHFVLVDGGEIAGRGAATSWQQIGSLVRDAGDDDRLMRRASTSERAARAERALAQAGISAGHPSLYPSRPADAAAAQQTAAGPELGR